MSTTTTAPQSLTAKDFATDQEVRWCPGCGDYSILAQMKKVLPQIGVPREQIVFVEIVVQQLSRFALQRRA